MSHSAIRVGVGGWNYQPWRGVFYPKGLPQAEELAYASRRLTAIEIDSTFYRNPGPETFKRWRDETPDDFVFTLKAPRYILNRRVLAESGEQIRKFVNGGVRELKEKLGAINWRFDERKPFDPDDFEACLKLLPGDVRNAVEVRHPSFRSEQFVELARKFQVAIVMAGDSSYPQIADVTAPFVYMRVMGTSSETPNGYSEEQLDAWADRAKAYAGGRVPSDLDTFSPRQAEVRNRDVFLFFINGFKQVNPAAAMALIERSPS